MTPARVHALVRDGHEVLVEHGAGLGRGTAERPRRRARARRGAAAAEVWGWAEMIVKVKEPLPSEYPLLGRGQSLFTYLHLAPLPELTDVLLEREVAGIAYETIHDGNGRLPLLTPMS